MSSSEFEFAVNTVWVLVAAFLVFFMQAGFAMVETGFTRAKNAGNIIMKNTMDFAAGSLVYWAVGFAIMFGPGNGMVGMSGFFFRGVTAEALDINMSPYAFLLFQTVFAATAATIVSGAMAERTRFTAYLLYSLVISSAIYPVVGHWAWGGGWLGERGFIDFAGSSVVHSVGGWAALVGAAILGPRIGKYREDGTPRAIPGHSLTLGALGVFILWFGWFGFNPGSSLSGTDASIGYIAVTTNLAAAAAAVTVMLITWDRYGKPDVSMTLNGVLGGLVAITAGCAAVSPAGAVLIGVIAGGVLVYALEFIDKVLKIDDPVGAIGVHGVCGALGTVLVGVFASEGGLLYGGGTAQLVVQLTGVGAIAIWTFAAAFVLFKVIDALVGLRVPASEEVEGLDRNEHLVDAYGDFLLKPAGNTAE